MGEELYRLTTNCVILSVSIITIRMYVVIVIVMFLSKTVN